MRLPRGNGRGLAALDVVVVLLGVGVVWSIAGNDHFSGGSVGFAWVITGLGAIGLVARLLRL